MGDIEQILQTSWPILLMVVIFYFLLWRPQKKQQKERANLLSSLKKGQKIVTIGGIYGEIIELDDEKVKVQVAEKVEMTFARTAIASVVSKKIRKLSNDNKRSSAPGVQVPARCFIYCRLCILDL